MATQSEYQKLHVIGLGLTLGIVWGVSVFLMGIIAMWTGSWGVKFVKFFGSLYHGYDASFAGSITGLLWGFVDCFIGGAVIAWIYNRIVECCGKR